MRRGGPNPRAVASPCCVSSPTVRTRAQPIFLIESGDAQGAIRKVVGEDPEIKILVLAAGGNGRGPGPLVTAVLKQGAAFGGRKLPVTIVPGELTDAEIEDLA